MDRPFPPKVSGHRSEKPQIFVSSEEEISIYPPKEPPEYFNKRKEMALGRTKSTLAKNEIANFNQRDMFAYDLMHLNEVTGPLLQTLPPSHYYDAKDVLEMHLHTVPLEQFAQNRTQFIDEIKKQFENYEVEREVAHDGNLKVTAPHINVSVWDGEGNRMDTAHPQHEKFTRAFATALCKELKNNPDKLASMSGDASAKTIGHGRPDSLRFAGAGEEARLEIRLVDQEYDNQLLTQTIKRAMDTAEKLMASNFVPAVIPTLRGSFKTNSDDKQKMTEHLLNGSIIRPDGTMVANRDYISAKLDRISGEFGISGREYLMIGLEQYWLIDAVAGIIDNTKIENGKEPGSYAIRFPKVEVIDTKNLPQLAHENKSLRTGIHCHDSKEGKIIQIEKCLIELAKGKPEMAGKNLKNIELKAITPCFSYNTLLGSVEWQHSINAKGEYTLKAYDPAKDKDHALSTIMRNMVRDGIGEHTLRDTGFDTTRRDNDLKYPVIIDGKKYIYDYEDSIPLDVASGERKWLPHKISSMELNGAPALKLAQKEYIPHCHTPVACEFTVPRSNMSNIAGVDWQHGVEKGHYVIRANPPEPKMTEVQIRLRKAGITPVIKEGEILLEGKEAVTAVQKALIAPAKKVLLAQETLRIDSPQHDPDSPERRTRDALEKFNAGRDARAWVRGS